MVEDIQSQVLEHLKKKGQTNTFKLAGALGIDRHLLLTTINKLEDKQAVELKTGIVKFLKFPKEEKPIKVKKAVSEPKREVKHKAKKVSKSRVLENLRDENKTLREKLLGLETSIKKQPYLKSKLREQTELIEKLGKRIEALREKAKVSPKIITRKIKVPPKIITRTKVKTIIKKVPVRVKERETKKFKLPEFNLPSIKNIQQLEKPEFLEQKIVAGRKINFSRLNRDIQQLNVPETLRNP